MRVLLATVAAALILCAVMLVRKAGRLDRELSRTALRPERPSRWPTQPRQSYPPSAWPALSRLRRTLFVGYACGAIGVILLARACSG